MIGTPIKATLWQVTYRYRPEDRPEDLVAATILLTTADPSGANVYEVARRVVMKEAPRCTAFEMIGAARQAELFGLANVESGASQGNSALLMTTLQSELASAQRQIAELGGCGE